MTGDPVTLAREAAERLAGTCGSVADLGPEFEAAQNDMEFCAELDSLVFECSCCGWWCEIGEEADYRTCIDCVD